MRSKLKGGIFRSATKYKISVYQKDKTLNDIIYKGGYVLPKLT